VLFKIKDNNLKITIDNLKRILDNNCGEITEMNNEIFFLDKRNTSLLLKEIESYD